MSDNEKLIEEARGRAGSDMGLSDQLLRELADALEAAEKAHTPTNDEREALMKLTDVACGPRADERYADGWSGARQEIRLRIAAWPGFRRSEVPEPSAPMSLADDPMRKPFLKKRAEAQGEPSDAAARALAIHDAWGTPNDPEGKTRPLSDYTNLSAAMAAALRAAGGVR